MTSIMELQIWAWSRDTSRKQNHRHVMIQDLENGLVVAKVCFTRNWFFSVKGHEFTWIDIDRKQAIEAMRKFITTGEA